MEKRNWENTRYTKQIRITEEDHAWLKKEKGKLTLAGKLEEVIKKIKNKKYK